MIIIGRPYIEEIDNKARLVCDVSVNGDMKHIYVEVDKQYEKYLCTERCDGFLIVLFYYAMRNELDIVCEAPVSEDLFYQITEYLIPLLRRTSDDNLYNINISCLTACNLVNEGAVGTSVTGGVDSFYSIYKNINNTLDSKKLTHLTIMSIADSYKKEGRYEYIKDKIYENADKIAEQLNLPVVKINSNMREVFPIPPMHTLIRLFGVYSLQKLFGTYYFSSGYPVWNFNMEESSTKDSARYDLLLCKELSTKNLFVYSEGSQVSRLEKIEKISKYDLVKKSLHVCIDKEYNCGVCSKCVRTILGLDSINKLDEFSEVFDVDYYYANQDFYFNTAYELYKKGDLYIFDYIDKLKKKYNSEILNKIPDLSSAHLVCYDKNQRVKLSPNKLIIGISGGSSCGKSTIVNYLRMNLSDVDVISVDDYMMAYLDMYKSEIIKKLNIDDNNKHWCNYIYNSCEDVESWINIIKPDVSRCIDKKIINSKNRIVIVDTFMLPLLDIFKECDIKINVKSDTDVKLPRIKERLSQVGRLDLFDDESIINRLEHTVFNEYDDCYDYTIVNNDDVITLKNDCGKILNKMKK